MDSFISGAFFPFTTLILLVVAIYLGIKYVTVKNNTSNERRVWESSEQALIQRHTTEMEAKQSELGELHERYRQICLENSCPDRLVFVWVANELEKRVDELEAQGKRAAIEGEPIDNGTDLIWMIKYLGQTFQNGSFVGKKEKFRILLIRLQLYFKQHGIVSEASELTGNYFLKFEPKWDSMSETEEMRVVH